jgi:hypothetical protein
MIFATLVGVSLALNVSLDNPRPAWSDRTGWLHMPVPQREAALLPLVHSATECIVRKVGRDPRYRSDLHADEINEIIIDSIDACGALVRAMIAAHDQLYGAGSGEAFLLGPYLDVLPTAVVKQVKIRPR